MSGFVLHLQSPTQYERIDAVASFVGEDASGSFGILPHHAAFMTALAYGLCRFRSAADWTYVALPGGLLHFAGNELRISTRRYCRDADYARVAHVLAGDMRAEEEKLSAMVKSFRRLERGVVQRLWDLERSARGPL